MKSHIKITTLTLFALFSTLTHANKNILNIYSWGNDFPNEIIFKFSKETGIKINLTEYDNNETMYAKLKASKHTSYDIVIPSNYYIERMSKQGMLHQLDKKKLSNLRHINPIFLNQQYDPKNKYSIPYTLGSTGIIINTKYINKNKITKWEDFWNPKYKNQLMMINDMREVFAVALLSLGYSVNDTNPKHIKEAYLKLKKLLPNVKIFNIDTVPNIYIDEDAIIGMVWSGDCRIAQEENPNLHYIYPKEGFSIWIDNFAITKNAEHLENAYKFIDFMLHPENAKQASLIIGHSVANKTTMKLMPKKLQNNIIYNPSDSILKHGTMQRDIPEKIRQIYEKYWEKLKIGD